MTDKQKLDILRKIADEENSPLRENARSFVRGLNLDRMSEKQEKWFEALCEEHISDN